jgi:hypothetical protein
VIFSENSSLDFGTVFAASTWEVNCWLYCIQSAD